MQSGNAINKKRNPYLEFNRAFNYFVKIGWCDNTKNELNNFKCLLVLLDQVSNNMVKILDGFMNNKELFVFLILHSVFRPDARRNGEFIEQYMINRLKITDEQLSKVFNRNLPPELQKQFAMFEPEIVPFELFPYRVEYGCRPNPLNGERSWDPIKVIDLDFDFQEKQEMIDIKKFLSQYESIVL